MSKPLRVLLVEDSEDDAQLILRQLRLGGYDPIFERVETEEAMSAALDRQEWDIVLADYSMPEFSGAAALALLQETGLDLPFLLVSGAIGEEAAVAMMKFGAQDYIMKGNLVRLPVAIERALAEAQGRRERKRAQEEIHRNYDTQAVINSLLGLFMENIPLAELLKRAVDLIVSIRWLAFEKRGGIFCVEDDPEVLVMKAQSGLSEPIQKSCARVPFGKCLCGKAALTQKIQFADRFDDRHQIRYEEIIAHGHYNVPILSEGKTLGVINVYVREGHRHDPKEEQFLTAVANALAGIILRKQAEQEQKRLGDELKQSLANLQKAMEGTIQAIALTVETRDPYTAGHQRRVTDLACAIAGEMGLLGDQVEGIRMAGVVHDLGKIHVPAEILSKPSKLSDSEFDIVKTHAQVGYDILKAIEFPWPVAQVVFQHHERIDGSGYPSGLSEADILAEARILAVADVVEAMASTDLTDPLWA